MMIPATLGLILFQLVSSHGGPPATASTKPGSAAGVTWTVPKGWTVAANPSAMRLATYKVAPAPGDTDGGEVSVFTFAKGDGGSVDSNIARWQGQFQVDPKNAASQPAPKKVKVGPIDVTVVTAQGTFSSGMPGGTSSPKAGWSLRGAIVEGPSGSVFFKLVGPKKTIQKETPNFDLLIQSLKRN